MCECFPVSSDTTEYHFCIQVNRIQQKWLTWCRVWAINNSDGPNPELQSATTDQMIHPVPQPQWLLSYFHQSPLMDALHQMTRMCILATVHVYLQMESCPYPKFHIPEHKQSKRQKYTAGKKAKQQRKMKSQKEAKQDKRCGEQQLWGEAAQTW